ncbi:hypothetical protein [Mucisphaera sp.]|uniref:hypothetical protein n=1 Tax=Mucisphaera sp. TaxID=2913024 RepID=UPI003D0F320D
MTTLHIGAIPVTDQLLESLDALLARLDQQELTLGTSNRETERRGVSAPVELGVLSGPEEPDALPNPDDFRPLYPGWITDTSPVGLGILTERDLPGNIRLWADLTRLAGQPLLLPVRVIYCLKVLRSTYRVGLAFELPNQPLAA